MNNKKITYDELMGISGSISLYLWQCLRSFHLFYGYSKHFDGRKLTLLNNAGLIEQKDQKYVLTLRGKLIITKRLGIQS